MTTIDTAPVKGDRDYDPARRPASPLTKRQAQALTDRIAKAVDGLWVLLAEARDKKAWAPLGYASWDQYVKTEFGLSRGQSYRLLDQAKVIGELETAADVPAGAVDVSGRAAADIKHDLDTVVGEVREATAGLPEAERAEVARDVVEAHRPKPEAVVPDAVAPPVESIPSDAFFQSTPDPEPEAAARPAETAEPIPWRVPQIVTLLVGLDPATATDLTDLQWLALRKWMDHALTARTNRNKPLKQAGARATKRAAAEPEKVTGCKHPIGRRLGDRCAACGETVR